MKLIKKPINVASGKEYEKCSYALYPGDMLTGAEPELVVKMYDSLLFQHPDTAIWLDKDFQRETWAELGKPTLIVTCPSQLEKFQQNFPDIPVITIYYALIQWEISGGCYEEDCYIYEDDTTVDKQIKFLAEDMGASIHNNVSEPEIYPYLTSRISIRDKLRSEGKKSTHILELIYGFGTPDAVLTEEEKKQNRLDLKQALLKFYWNID